MKRHNILSCLLAASALLGSFASCSDNGLDSPTENGLSSDAKTITFTVSLESQQTATRDGGNTGYKNDYTDWFSDGSNIDKLIFAVYKKDSTTDKYKIDSSFSKADQTNDQKQNVINEVKFPFSIQLIPDPDASYKIVFWAQNSYCDAFNTSDLESIKINYDKLNMNDETGDAFTDVLEFSSNSDRSLQVVLKRPLAQINIGTSGWDYEGKAILKPNPEVIKYSTMTVKGVASKFNALENKVELDEADNEVTFGWNVIPAYRRYVFNNNNNEEILENIDVSYITDQSLFLFDNKKNPEPDLMIDEIYLNVDLNADDNYEDYIGWYQYKSKTDNVIKEVNGSEETYSDEDLSKKLNEAILTEQFKYLATCYVLVGGTKANGNDNSATYAATVDVTFNCAKEKPVDNSVESETDNPFSFTVPNVPVNRNWRTNIVSATGSGLFMDAAQFKVDVYPETFADYYKRLSATDNNWNDSNGTFGDQDNDDYEWPEDDIYPNVMPSLPSLNWGTTIETINWNPLNIIAMPELSDFIFEIDPINFKNNTDSDNGDVEHPKYSYKVYAEYNGEKYEDGITVEEGNEGKTKVTISNDWELLKSVFNNSDNSFTIVVQAFKENGHPLTEPVSAKVSLGWEFSSEKTTWAWIFKSEKDPEDNLDGNTFYTNLNKKTGVTGNETFTESLLTLVAAEDRNNKAEANHIYLAGKGDTTKMNLHFTVYSPCFVEVEYETGNSNYGRHAVINCDGNATDGEDSTTDRKTVNAAITFDNDNTEGKTVYVYSAKDGLNIYSIKIKPVD